MLDRLRVFSYSSSDVVVEDDTSATLADVDRLQISRKHGSWRIFADLNGDGFLDRLCAYGETDTWNAAYGDGSEVLAFPYGNDCGNSAGNWNVPAFGEPTYGYISRSNDYNYDNHTTIDMNGDGIPDFVHRDISSNSVHVYLGECVSQFDCGFADVPQVWSAPGGAASLPLIHTWSDDPGAGHRSNLVDMTGDGLPDVVRLQPNQDWLVFENLGTDFNPTPIAYANASADPHGLMRANMTFTTNALTHSYYRDRELMDVNGDGLVDLISAPHFVGGNGELGPEKYFLVDAAGGLDGPYDLSDGVFMCADPNTSVKMCNPATFPSGSAIVGAAEVRLNTGSGFADAVYSPAPFWFDGDSYASGADRLRASNTEHGGKEIHTFRDFVDVNGDGLVDWVSSGLPYGGSGDTNWYALLNLGDGRFGGPLNNSQGASTVGGWLKLGVVTPGTVIGGLVSDVGYSFSHTNPSDRVDVRVATIDIDGDGSFERIETIGGGVNTEWTIKRFRYKDDYGRSVSPRLLTKIDGGLGGFSEIQYSPKRDYVTASPGDPHGGVPFPLWVVSGMRSTDGLCDTTPTDWFDITSSPPGNPCLAAGHELVEKIEYDGGFFDGDDREFRGFRTVEVTTGPASTGSTRKMTFHVDKHRAGRMEFDETFVGGVDLLSRTEFDWQTVADGKRTQVYVREQRVHEYSLYEQFGTYEDSCVVHRTSIALSSGAHDPKNRPQETCSMSCVGAGTSASGCAPTVAGKKSVLMSYAAPGGASGIEVWDRPAGITSYYVDDSNTTVLSGETQFSYDELQWGLVEKGNLTKENNRIDSTSWTTRVIEYDDGSAGPGNRTEILVVSGVPREPTTFEYDSEFSIFRTATILPKTTNSEGVDIRQRTTEEYDYRHGEAIRRVGPLGAGNGDVAGVILDVLGRPTCSYEPGTSCGGTGFPASVEYEYHYGDPLAVEPFDRMSWVEVRSREPNSPTDYLVSRGYWDALGRERLMTTEMNIQPPGSGGGSGTRQEVVVQHRTYDPFGFVSGEAERYIPTGPLSTTIP